ncbi:nitric oxide synthase oxygenase [Lysinibacillus agricola]|uniref:Nitric oxide synthase oxygenase n=1 Tax=Lysinibacillus agricola TaxID=2590012 RepID=A0ABX7ASG9_9BACI|nr:MULTISPECIES: nitric oxide synthase oxygenase [Lysinibacillus]KOS60507.1 nitric oxide synthase [Lysinibacillus sp. FJAT-14222]QQP12756.1 nitric oxide synthase oxygenase [Lysinibacillus agricola]
MNLHEIQRFLELYQMEQNESKAWLENKLQQIKAAGKYIPTTEELTFGARVAWRNSNKCIGRLFWQSLHVVDARDISNEEDIFNALLEHIQYATNDGKIRPTITVFAPGRVRIWNHQLIRYAGYEMDSGIVGDPHSVEFTKICESLGWQGEKTAFDVLPLVIQIDGRDPQAFTIPDEYVLEVPIRHPESSQVEKLGSKWYAVPIISSMRFQMAGIDFQAAPFNGWYMGTEIGARNLADHDRYNMLPAIAEIFNLDTTKQASLWRDRALVELNIAVLHSFKEDGVSIVDHHTAAQQFKLFEEAETAAERELTGNWTWLIPPLSPATTHIFHKPYVNLYNTPNYFYQKPPY